MKNLLLVAPVFAAMVGSGHAATYSVQDAFKVGAFVDNNFAAGTSGSESEGVLIIGGNMSATSLYQVSLRAGANTMGNVALAVGGSISSSSGIKASGNVTYGTTTSGSIDLTLSSAAGIPTPRSLTQDTSVASAVDSTFSDLRSLSSKIAALANSSAQDGAITVSGGNYSFGTASKITDLSIMSKSFYMFNINASDINSGGKLEPNGALPFGAGDIVVFNIIDSSPGMQTAYLKLAGLSNFAGNILWNVSSTTLNLATGDDTFYGTLLAPNSTFTQNGKEVNGGLIVKEFQAGSGGAELHPVNFNGGIVPEPSSALAGVLLALGLTRRQRR